MKRVIVLLLFMSSLITVTNCGKVKERRMTDKLTAKTWTLYKVEINGSNLLASTTDFDQFTFKNDGNYYIHTNAIITNGPNIGGWSIDGSVLTLTNNGIWDIKTLTDTELKLEQLDNQGDPLTAYFR